MSRGSHHASRRDKVRYRYPVLPGEGARPFAGGEFAGWAVRYWRITRGRPAVTHAQPRSGQPRLTFSLDPSARDRKNIRCMPGGFRCCHQRRPGRRENSVRRMPAPAAALWRLATTGEIPQGGGRLQVRRYCRAPGSSGFAVSKGWLRQTRNQSLGTRFAAARLPPGSLGPRASPAAGSA